MRCDKQNKKEAAFIAAAHIFHCLHNSVFVSWILYYAGVSSSVVILLLTVPPCFAFILFALGRKNIIAVVPAVCFYDLSSDIWDGQFHRVDCGLRSSSEQRKDTPAPRVP